MRETMILTRRQWLIGAAALPFAVRYDLAAPAGWTEKLVAAAKGQIGVTVHYDPDYTQLDYPMGDVPRDRGVCTDVVIRAYRDGLSLDLQRLVHEDMAAHFSKYPAQWGLKRTDRNIDHRRVPNLATFFTRMGGALAVDDVGTDIAAGDLLTMIVPPGLTHIAIASDRRSEDGTRPYLLHNIGGGTREEDRLLEFRQTGRFRFSG